MEKNLDKLKESIESYLDEKLNKNINLRYIFVKSANKYFKSKNTQTARYLKCSETTVRRLRNDHTPLLSKKLINECNTHLDKLFLKDEDQIKAKPNSKKINGVWLSPIELSSQKPKPKKIEDLLKIVNEYFDVQIENKKHSFDKTRATYIFIKTSLKLGFRNKEISKILKIKSQSVSGYLKKYVSNQPCSDLVTINNLAKEITT